MKLVLLQDADDTHLNWSEVFDEKLNENPRLVNVPRSTGRTRFDLWSGRTAEERVGILKIMNSPRFYRALTPLPGSVEAIKEMQADGHEVVFCSSPWYTNRTCMDDKAWTIAKYYGDEARDSMVLTKKKHLIYGDILFDDRAPIEHADRASWIQIIKDGPHNQSVPGVRLTDWSNWRTVLEQALETRITNEYAILGS